MILVTVSVSALISTFNWWSERWEVRESLSCCTVTVCQHRPSSCVEIIGRLRWAAAVATRQSSPATARQQRHVLVTAIALTQLTSHP